jgi:hypothetical protein
MQKLARTLLLTAAFASLTACHGSDVTGPVSQVEADGVVRYVSLESGFYSLESGQGKFDPMNLPTDYRQDGLRVHFVGVVRHDMGSTHMYGQILQLSDIRKR